MRQLLESGAHFGHQTHRWNPKMERYIFGSRSNIHIIDLSQTIPLLHQALVKVREVAASGGRILFVGTKRQASEPIATAARRCAQYYVNHRWLGGTLTNWRTVSGSIARLRELEGLLEGEGQGRSKKELLTLTRERDKLELSLGGIKDMGGIPDLMFVIDTNKEAIAIQEARKLNIPVIAILDTNCNPDGITYPIPGNDDAARAIQLYCDLMADAILDGLAAGQAASGVDLGASEAPVEPALARELAPEAEAPAAEAPAAEATAAEAPAEAAPEQQ
jgi:small subunit ribosomal protein S2